MKLLETKGKLLRIYSQNIDMLEYAAGVSEDLCVLCHGSFATATCLSCKHTIPGREIRTEISEKRVPLCKSCDSSSAVIKPDIVFFGEQLPDRFHHLIQQDEKKADLVLVMGSSLNVNPVRGIINKIPADIPQVLINRELAGHPNQFDVELLGYSDEILEYLVKRMDWELPDLEKDLFDEELLQDHLDTTTPRCSDSEDFQYEFLRPSRYHFPGAIEREKDTTSDHSSIEEYTEKPILENDESLGTVVDQSTTNRGSEL